VKIMMALVSTATAHLAILYIAALKRTERDEYIALIFQLVSSWLAVLQHPAAALINGDDFHSEIFPNEAHIQQLLGRRAPVPLRTDKFAAYPTQRVQHSSDEELR
jgi:hypothetical protein